MKCRYCGCEAKFVPNEQIYGRRFGRSYMAWWCKKCDASVGVHNNDPERPLGKNLANKELRKKKMEVKNILGIGFVPGIKSLELMKPSPKE